MTHKTFDIKVNQAVLSIGLLPERLQTLMTVLLRIAAVRVRKCGRRKAPFAGGDLKREKRMKMQFRKELYSKVALIKAAYNYTDNSYVHLDADDQYYYVSITPKDEGIECSEQEFINEMLIQSVRHEVYLQTKNIRELLLARAMATSLIVEDNNRILDNEEQEVFSEDEILKDWFEN